MVNSLTKEQIIFVVWLSVAGMLFLYYGFKHIKFIRTLQRWVTDVDPATANVLENLKQHLNISKNIQLKKCSCITSPILLHLKQPTILLPASSFTVTELNFVLRHELIHFKRRDLLLKKVMVIMLIVNWFNPIVYLIAKKFTELCELACDEQVTESFSQTEKYQYATIIMETAARQIKGDTILATSFYGGKQNMKKRILEIIQPSGKKLGKASIAICFTASILLSSVLAIPTYGATTDKTLSSYGIKSDREIDAEMKEAFSEFFSNKFDESEFSGMTIRYDKNGIPIVTDPNPIKNRAVVAKGRSQKNGFYSTSSCNSTSLVFWITKGSSVQVLDSSASTNVAKVKYANKTGYMKKSELVF